MLKIKDYSSYQHVKGFTYGGKAGQKYAINVDGVVWMIKFPQKINKEETTIGVSYTDSPISEYIGSHVYESIGIPVHETMLGIYQGKVIVLCKDFVEEHEGARFNAAENLLNILDPEKMENIYHSPDSLRSLHNMSINDWILFFESDVAKTEYTGFEERFWDQFVVDALISNSDRHGGNWSYFVDTNSHIELAPVYDNGNSFLGKTTEEKLEKLMDSEQLNPIINNGNTPFVIGHHKLDSIKSIKTLSIGHKKEYKPLREAIIRIYPKIDIEKIHQIIDDIPEQSNGVPIISKTRKEVYKTILKVRAEKIFKKAYKKALSFNNERDR